MTLTAFKAVTHVQHLTELIYRKHPVVRHTEDINVPCTYLCRDNDTKYIASLYIGSFHDVFESFGSAVKRATPMSANSQTHIERVSHCYRLVEEFTARSYGEVLVPRDHQADYSTHIVLSLKKPAAKCRRRITNHASPDEIQCQAASP